MEELGFTAKRFFFPSGSIVAHACKTSLEDFNWCRVGKPPGPWDKQLGNRASGSHHGVAKAAVKLRDDSLENFKKPLKD